MSLLAAILVLAHGLSWELTRHLRHRRPILPVETGTAAARLVFALLLLAAAGAIHTWEIESDLVLPLVGILLIASSITLRKTRSPHRLAAEGIALTGATALCEVLWLAPLPVLFYAALILDRRLVDRDDATVSGRLPMTRRLVSSHLYALLVASSILCAIAKEVLT